MKSILTILLYPHYPLPPVIDSFRQEGIHVDRWNVCKHKKHEFPSKSWFLRIWAATFLRWIPQIRKFKNKTLYATAAHFPLLAIAKLFGFLMADYHIYLDNFYLHALGQNRAVRAILSWLIANPRVTIFTYAPNEADYFRALSPIPTIHFIPFCSDFTPVTGSLPPDFLPRLTNRPQTSDSDPRCDPRCEVKPNYIFTGGYSNRDYDLIYRLAELFPSQTFVIVASNLNRLAERLNPPSNIILYTDLPNAQFESLLASSSILIIPLKENVGSSGQMLAISALRNAKPTIYTDLPVISYFFTPDSGIPYKLNDLTSLANTLHQLLENPTLLQTLTSNARKSSENFTTATQLRLQRQSIHL